MKTHSTEKKPSFLLHPGQDFTTSALVDFLNEKYGGKKTGKPFTIGDIQQYIRRGFLPKSYGNCEIEVVENEQIGVKVIRVKF